VFGSALAIAVLLVAVTRPLGSTDGRPLPVPGQTQYVFRSPVPGLEPGSIAPEFGGTLADGTAFQLTDLEGRPILLGDLRGKAVWVNFWASWCPPCQAETPIMRELDQRYRERGLVIVAVNVQETVEAAKGYADRYGLEYVIGADVSGHVFRQYRVFGLPTQFFIDPDGIVRSVVPSSLTLEGATRYVESILPPGGP
jgi:thiol-disulfide isomerase/thioredoxin